ncbi:polyphenol oxidase family protein [Dictyoglomus sp.]|jgi:YfiH family protein|uniref:polyphenol oxidase family protein n=1 Tax=Dictyoglomus sp. TaxID=28205 RepID=UPI003D143C90
MIWRSKLLSEFSEISHGFVSYPFSFPFKFGFRYLYNYLRFFFLIKVPSGNWIFADQVHGDKIYLVKKEVNKIFPKIAYKTDALLSLERKRPLIMFFADCMPIYIYVPKIKLVGLVHSGWRGTIRDFPLKVIKHIKESYSIDSKEILISVGPSIHSCCFEVKEDFISQLPKEYKKFIITRNHKTFYDLVELVNYQFKKENIPDSNIEISHICTFCDKNFYSFRRDRNSNRNLGYIFLK